ncbi:hypothetical protein G9A89_021134 [Geosiphon pyriformis]|nr:hypothetical protein G9A89_021134 [Geosiphon pyriformis]
MSSTPRKRPRETATPNNEPISKESKHCGHPKHETYISTLKQTSKNPKPGLINRKLVKVPKRMILALGVKEGTLICSRCVIQTDKDPQYLKNPKYVSQRVQTRKNVLSSLKIDMKDDPRDRRETRSSSAKALNGKKNL